MCLEVFGTVWGFFGGRFGGHLGDFWGRFLRDLGVMFGEVFGTLWMVSKRYLDVTQMGGIKKRICIDVYIYV